MGACKCLRHHVNYITPRRIWGSTNPHPTVLHTTNLPLFSFLICYSIVNWLACYSAIPRQLTRAEQDLVNKTRKSVGPFIHQFHCCMLTTICISWSGIPRLKSRRRLNAFILKRIPKFLPNVPPWQVVLALLLLLPHKSLSPSHFERLPMSKLRRWSISSTKQQSSTQLLTRRSRGYMYLRLKSKPRSHAFSIIKMFLFSQVFCHLFAVHRSQPGCISLLCIRHCFLHYRFITVHDWQV